MDLFVILDEHSVAEWVAANLEIFLCNVTVLIEHWKWDSILIL